MSNKIYTMEAINIKKNIILKKIAEKNSFFKKNNK